ncbi:universal stress protein [bacterium]|nr:universal stress protein [bacterium]
MDQYKSILCPIDFSESSELALRYAVALAEQNHSRLIVLHSIPVSVILAGVPPIPVVNEPIWQEDIKRLLDKAVAPYTCRELRLDTKIVSGDAATQILLTARDEDVDLIVMGTHGTGGYEALFMGSVTNKILHKAKIPVLAVCKPTRAVLTGDPNEPLLIGKILCAIDPYHVNLSALRSALSLARFNKSTLYVLTVEDSKNAKGIVKDLMELLQPGNEKLCQVEFVQSKGDAVQEILQAIEYLEVDLAIMGHHNKGIRPFEALGSVTLRVIPRSKCAVLVVGD